MTEGENDGGNEDSEPIGDLSNPFKESAAAVEDIDNGTLEEAVDALMKAAASARNREISQEYGALGDPGATQGPPESAKDSASDYEWLEPHFKRFWSRPTGLAAGMADDLGRARGVMERTGPTVASGASDAVAQWAGEARNRFKENFLDPFPTAMDNQMKVIEELRAGLYLYEGIQRTSRKDALELAQKGKQALDELASGCDPTSAEAKFIYTMVGVVAWIAGTALPPISAPVMTFTLIGASGFTANGVSGLFDEPEPKIIEGDTVEQLLDNLVAKLDKLEEDQTESEAELGGVLADGVAKIEQMLNSDTASTVSALLPHEPNDDRLSGDITAGDVPGQDEFHPQR